MNREEKAQYIQFLKNMVLFVKVFGGPFEIKKLEEEIKVLETEE